MPANWKVVSEGFSETYHIQGAHPEMLGYMNDVAATQKLWNRHGVSYQDYGVPSPRLGREVPDQVIWETWCQSLGSRIGLSTAEAAPPMPEIPEGKTLQDVLAKMIVAEQAKRGVDISHYDTKTLTGAAQYNFFPNATMLVFSDMVSILSTRPGLTPDESHFVMTGFHRVPPGAPRSKPITIGADAGELPLGLVIGQDVAIMKTAQRGLHQPGITELAVAAEECRVVNLHRNLDEWCGA
jgi:phenylpropionate dioxygenase-like ring-hydroxylating dioxygenase large terminal subunit